MPHGQLASLDDSYLRMLPPDVISSLNETDDAFLGAFTHLMRGLVEVHKACPDVDKLRDVITDVLKQIVLSLTEADCVFVRRVNTDGSHELIGEPLWASHEQIGRPPHVKEAGEGISSWVIEHLKGKPFV